MAWPQFNPDHNYVQNKILSTTLQTSQVPPIVQNVFQHKPHFLATKFDRHYESLIKILFQCHSNIK